VQPCVNVIKQPYVQSHVSKTVLRLSSYSELRIILTEKSVASAAVIVIHNEQIVYED
jgi:hypothetical protein